MLNILITGAKGQLGYEITELSKRYNGFSFIFTDIEELDITDFNATDNFLKIHKFDFIVNCAGYTAVDKAEEETESAKLLNTIAPSFLAELCERNNIKLIHISTDYVFDGTGTKPYTEEDITNPVSVYGKTKLDGENEIISKTKNAIIIRTSWLYSTVGNNFMKTMIRLGKEKDEINVVSDQIGTPTYAGDLAKAVLEIIKKTKDKNFEKVEIYNYSNEGVARWYDFAVEIFSLAKIKCSVNPIKTEDYPTAAKRPLYSVFDKSKIKKDFNIVIPYWKESLKTAVKKYLK
ncbi:MAG: dTDP-4-dehydrorhamnose reductase [Bacteroidales bacterium]|nr:dTDP-4-dehydrorhamnose reductase [Bacteroidales bacterium]